SRPTAGDELSVLGMKARRMNRGEGKKADFSAGLQVPEDQSVAEGRGQQAAVAADVGAPGPLDRPMRVIVSAAFAPRRHFPQPDLRTQQERYAPVVQAELSPLTLDTEKLPARERFPQARGSIPGGGHQQVAGVAEGHVNDLGLVSLQSCV